MIVPVIVSIGAVAPDAWRDPSFVGCLVAAVFTVMALAMVVGRVAGGAVTEPLRQTALRLEALSLGDLSPADGSVPAIEVARIERAAREIVENAWKREKRYATAVGALAHDVRLSLAAIRTIVTNEIADEAAGEGRLSSGLAAALLGEVKRVQAMTDDLVVLMRPTVRNSHAPDVDIAAVADEVAGAVRITAGVVGIEVKHTKPFSRTLPRQVVERLLRNLVENAAKAARTGVMVEILDGLVIVADDGPGMPPLALVDEASSEPGSWSDARHGFGLDIASRLAEACEGRLVIERTGPTGTKVLVYL